MLLKAENIHKRFRSGEGYIEVLKHASLQVDKGEFAVLSGQSGSGKSTLLYILGGLIKPDSGLVEYNGKPLRDYNSDDFDRLRNRKIGFVFQMHHLMPDFTALENTIIPAMIKGENKEKAIELRLAGNKDNYSSIFICIVPSTFNSDLLKLESDSINEMRIDSQVAGVTISSSNPKHYPDIVKYFDDIKPLYHGIPINTPDYVKIETDLDFNKILLLPYF